MEVQLGRVGGDEREPEDEELVVLVGDLAGRRVSYCERLRSEITYEQVRTSTYGGQAACMVVGFATFSGSLTLVAGAVTAAALFDLFFSKGFNHHLLYFL